MTHVSVRTAREKLPQLLDRVEKGEEVVVTRRGKAVARMVPVLREPRRLPALTDFRKTIGRRGTPSVTLLRAERNAR
jgi:prevent-host-death family protein